jgi:ferredoxin
MTMARRFWIRLIEAPIHLNSMRRLNIARAASVGISIASCARYRKRGLRETHNFEKGLAMSTCVVCEPCLDCKYTDCVVVCPCECFYEDGAMLCIDPGDCIDCQACIPECPVEAIFSDPDVPSKWTSYIALNAERSAAIIASGVGHILEKQEPKLGPGCSKRA